MTRLAKARECALVVYRQRKARHRSRKAAWLRLRDATTALLRAEMRKR